MDAKGILGGGVVGGGGLGVGSAIAASAEQWVVAAVTAWAAVATVIVTAGAALVIEWLRSEPDRSDAHLRDDAVRGRIPGLTLTDRDKKDLLLTTVRAEPAPAAPGLPSPAVPEQPTMSTSVPRPS